MVVFLQKAFAPQTARYGRKLVALPYFGLTAAGPLKDTAVYPNQFIQFPSNVLKGHLADYFSLTVRGTSMTEAGISDGDTILLRKAEGPIHGAIMLIRFEDQTTIKRIKINQGKVFLCWEDGSDRQIEIDSANYEVQGKFIQVV
jgi:SOS-response transcriptional repressor LexA